ncbi:hypothetical protein BT69DRAFT_498321 [Atractiella rhizophila]|nr:hypothetical protein BT69DRAFT_498321 [Atractiella rhizophila]
MDVTSFASAAHCRILLVPIRPIKKKTFEKWASLIRTFSTISLADVPPDPRPNMALSSSPTSTGKLLLSYHTTLPPATPFLHTYSISRRVLGVIGILDCREFTSLEDGVQEFKNMLANYPDVEPLAARVYAFEPMDGQKYDVEGCVVIPSVGDMTFYLNTLIADFCSTILYELSNWATTIESLTSIPTPQETPSSSSLPPTSLPPVTPLTSVSANRLSLASIQPQRLSTFGGSSNALLSPMSSNIALSKSSSAPTSPTTLPRSISTPPLPGSSLASSSTITTSGTATPTTNGTTPRPLPQRSETTLGFSSSSSVAPEDPKSAKKLGGRAKKLLGDLYLLAGKLEEAERTYGESINHTKVWQDSVWQAGAMEGLAVCEVVKSYLTMQPPSASPTPTELFHPPRPVAPPPTSSPSGTSTTLSLQSDIPERFSQLIALYQKASSSSSSSPWDHSSSESAHPLLYVEACVRCLDFLEVLWRSDSRWDSRSVREIVEGRPLKDTERRVDRWKGLRVSLVSASLPAPGSNAATPTAQTVTKAKVGEWAALALSISMGSVQLKDRIRILVRLAGVYERLGWARKRAWCLREVAGLCAEGAGGREVEVIERDSGERKGEKKEEGVGLGIIMEEGKKKKRPANLSVITIMSGEERKKTPNAIRTTTMYEGNESVIRLVDEYLSVFGVEVITSADTKEDSNESDYRRISVLTQGESELGSEERKQDYFGWPSVQVAALRDAIGTAELLSDYQGAIRFTISALRSLTEFMLPSEQLRLSQNIPRIFSAAARRGLSLEMSFWGPNNLLMSIEAPQPALNRQVMERKRPDAEALTVASTSKNPFIYNPNARIGVTSTKVTLVESEPADFFVTLHNPFLFSLDIEKVSLCTSGVSFSSEPISVTIPPASYHPVRISGTPLEAGELVIKGCDIKLVGCAPQQFILPVWNEEDEKKQKHSSGGMLKDPERIKAQGLRARRKEQAGKIVEDGLNFVKCQVVSKQPYLTLRSTSLTHGSLMLYDGEISSFSIALENTSEYPVDFIELAFQDANTQSARDYISDNDLPPGELYEIELDLLQRPVFSWDPTKWQQRVEPNEEAILTVDCLGKLGCTSGTIQIDYGYLERLPSESPTTASPTFYTRRITCDISMTVHHSLNAASMDLLRFSTSHHEEPNRRWSAGHGRSASTVRAIAQTQMEGKLEEGLKNVDLRKDCLFTVDVRNLYGQPFDVTLERIRDSFKNSSECQSRALPNVNSLSRSKKTA